MLYDQQCVSFCVCVCVCVCVGRGSGLLRMCVFLGVYKNTGLSARAPSRPLRNLKGVDVGALADALFVNR
jgi:hypothetical protein